MTKPQFLFTMNFGQLAQLVTFAVAIFVWGARQDTRIAVVEYGLTQVGGEVEALRQDWRVQAKTQADSLTRIEAILSGGKS